MILHIHVQFPAFSLNFSLAGKGSFMTSEAKKKCPRGALSISRGKEGRGIWFRGVC